MGKIETISESNIVILYSPHYNKKDKNEFDAFVEKYKDLTNPKLLQDYQEILSKIYKILTDCGARENLFRPEGRNIKALPIFIADFRRKIGTLRLYCIRISDRILILGAGGIKKAQTLKENPELFKITEQLREIEHKIYIASKKLGVNYDDYYAMKKIIESITIEDYEEE